MTQFTELPPGKLQRCKPKVVLSNKTQSSLLKKSLYFHNAEGSVTVTVTAPGPEQLKTGGHYTARTANKEEKQLCLHADSTRESSIFR